MTIETPKPLPIEENKICPVCRVKGSHYFTPQEEWIQYHPDMGHGYTKEGGWSKDGLKK
jgi:hypothetical protein